MEQSEYTFYTGEMLEKDEGAVFGLLCECDKEFFPPLSSRNGTTQGNLSAANGDADKPYTYFEELKKQYFVVIYDEGKLCAFLSYRLEKGENETDLYISTLCIAHSYRGRGLLRVLYDKTEEEAEKIGADSIKTRTWSTHEAQIKTLSKRGYTLFKEIKNDRAEGVGTVYYVKKIK